MNSNDKFAILSVEKLKLFKRNLNILGCRFQYMCCIIIILLYEDDIKPYLVARDRKT